VWLTYRALSRHNVRVSLDGHGADELMGAYRQEGRIGGVPDQKRVGGSVLKFGVGRPRRGLAARDDDQAPGTVFPARRIIRDAGSAQSGGRQ